MFMRLVHWLAFRWILSVILGAVAALVIYLYPDMGWLQRLAVLFMAGIVIARLLAPLRRGRA